MVDALAAGPVARGAHLQCTANCRAIRADVN